MLSTFATGVEKKTAKISVKGNEFFNADCVFAILNR